MLLMEFQSAESALLMLLFVGFASANAKLKGEAVALLPLKTFWATVVQVSDSVVLLLC